MTDVVALARSLVDIPSVTGDEGAVSRFLEDFLRSQGWKVERQEVVADRFNLWAWLGDADPEILLSTHLDTVPPFIPSREDAEYLWGRGSCDAKGLAAAMFCAAEELRQEDFKAPGLLFLVGEEVDSIGAKRAAEQGRRCKALINGEPTERHLALGHKGSLLLRLKAVGRTAHSGYPQEGHSAIDDLLDVLQDLRTASFPTDRQLGESLLNIGLIRGGRAANVVADEAEADLMIRCVAPCQVYLDILRDRMRGRSTLETVSLSQPQRLAVVEGFPTAVMGYATDIPHLRPLGTPLLYGPGSILVAHTPEERIAKADLRQGVEDYKRLVRTLTLENVQDAHAP